MGGILSKPKAPDNSAQIKAQAEQEKRIVAEEEAAKKKEAATLQARRARASGKASLITGEETGVTRTTLG
jgi:hypothetical protein